MTPQEPVPSKKRQCVYCGRPRPETMDHVPPKCLFRPPRPNLITVPSCTRCHDYRTALDDEYFKTMVLIRDDVQNHPDVQALLPILIETFAEPKRRKFSKSILNKFDKFDVISPAGLYIGSRWACDVDAERIERVLGRYTRGLFYHENKQRVPRAYQVISRPQPVLQSGCQEWLLELAREALVPLMANPPKVFGNNVFQYRFARCESDDVISAWQYLFYEGVVFISLVLPMGYPMGYPERLRFRADAPTID